MYDEQWSPAVGFQGYDVSTLGRVRSRKTGKVMKPWLNHQGYWTIELCTNGERAALRVHRIVAQTFIANPNNLPQVNHKNGNKADSRAENLEWVTNGQNQVHAIELGTRGTLLKPSDVREIWRLKANGAALSDVVKAIGKSKNAVREAYYGRSWKRLQENQEVV